MRRTAKSLTTKPRKVPRQPRSEMTVSALLEAAAQVLERAGLQGFNTNEVARRAGVSIGSLYQYFPGKDAILLALMRREKELFYNDARGALDKPNGLEAMSFLIEAAVRQQLLRPNLALLLDQEESRPPLRDDARAISHFSGLLLQVVSRPDLPSQADYRLAAKDVGAIVSGMIDAAGERHETDMPALERRVKAAVFGYLQHAAVAATEVSPIQRESEI